MRRRRGACARRRRVRALLPLALVWAAHCAASPGAADPARAAPAGDRCPAEVELVADVHDAASRLDLGWSGIGHGLPLVTDVVLALAVGPCDGRPCGRCALSGPVARERTPEGAAAGRCVHAPHVTCAPGSRCGGRCVGGPRDGAGCGAPSDCPPTGVAECAEAGPCVVFFGSSVPLPAGGVPSCILNALGSARGEADLDTGTGQATLRLEARVFTGASIERPCPRCSGDRRGRDGVRDGRCEGGPRDGLPCDGHGTSPFPTLGSTSLDCPPPAGARIATLPLAMTLASAGAAWSVDAASPACTAAGQTRVRCLCDTCQTAAAEPCRGDADCPPGRACGGRRCLAGPRLGAPCRGAPECDGGPCGRRGATTRPHACSGATPTCVARPDGVGACATGPFDGRCLPSEPFRMCDGPADCVVAGDTCTFVPRRCFPDGRREALTALGRSDTPVGGEARLTVGALFCIGPTASSSVNEVIGLPGPGRLQMRGMGRAVEAPPAARD